MLLLRKQGMTLYVDRSVHRWIVRDTEGNYWLLPVGENPWDHREPFMPTDETDLEPIPGHYKDMLGLPF
jgi:hypothetical protein